VILLSIAARALGAEEADHVALALTLVQAALVVPTQFALVAQPRLVSDTGMAFRRTFTGIQASLSLALTLLAFVVAAAITTAGSLEWGVLGVMAASILPLGLGLTGGYALLLAEGAGARFVAAPWVMLALLAIAGALSAELDGGVWLAAWWAIASTAGALSQRLNASWAHLARPLAIGLGSSILCVAAGFVAPALAAVTAAALLVGVRRSLAQGLADARALIAAQR
jgi:hypothetical protein